MPVSSLKKLETGVIFIVLFGIFEKMDFSERYDFIARSLGLWYTFHSD